MLEAKGDQVKAKWVVGDTMFGNKVRNEIESTLTFDAQGKVSAQAENRDEKKWMSQAPAGEGARAQSSRSLQSSD